MSSAVVATTDGHADREAANALTSDACQALDNPAATLTPGVDKGYDAQEFIEALQEMYVTPQGVARRCPMPWPRVRVMRSRSKSANSLSRPSDGPRRSAASLR